MRWLDGHEFEQTPGDSERRGLACCTPWHCKESDTTQRLNNTSKGEGAYRSSVKLWLPGLGAGWIVPRFSGQRPPISQGQSSREGHGNQPTAWAWLHWPITRLWVCPTICSLPHTASAEDLLYQITQWQHQKCQIKRLHLFSGDDLSQEACALFLLLLIWSLNSVLEGGPNCSRFSQLGYLPKMVSVML